MTTIMRAEDDCDAGRNLEFPIGVYRNLTGYTNQAAIL
jgi:hypothetical protein